MKTSYIFFRICGSFFLFFPRAEAFRGLKVKKIRPAKPGGPRVSAEAIGSAPPNPKKKKPTPPWRGFRFFEQSYRSLWFQMPSQKIISSTSSRTSFFSFIKRTSSFL